jgi:secondary thiamine-phosphate synthase enzyme
MILSVTTHRRSELIDITAEVRQAAGRLLPGASGICLIYVPHTTAGVTINESADPDVAVDLLGALDTLVPFAAGYRHREGNSAAHIKSTLVGASQTLAVDEGRLVLGTWQGIFFCEFDGPRARKVIVQCLADPDRRP